MPKHSGVKFGGAALRRFYASWKLLRWGTDIQPTTVCGITRHCNVRNHNPKGQLALFYLYNFSLPIPLRSLDWEGQEKAVFH